jgi:hypothetical protein
MNTRCGNLKSDNTFFDYAFILSLKLLYVSIEVSLFFHDNNIVRLNI